MAAIVLALVFTLNLLAQAVPNACDGKKLPRFEQYPAAPYDGKPHFPVLATPLDRKYRTTIRKAAAAGANFAGHFAIAHWGCGTGCQEFVIIDLESGAVHHPPFIGVGLDLAPNDFQPPSAWQCYSGLTTYRRDSRLLVVEGCLIPSMQCGRTYFTMEAGRLKQVAFDPDQPLHARATSPKSR